MKTRFNRWAARRAFGFGTLLTLTLLLAALSVSAQTPCTSTGWVNAVLAPGIVCTNALGQVLVRGNVHTARVQGSDARVTGQVLIITDGSYNADGTANVQGPAYLQVGTWDAPGTNFTPTGGMWELTWRGLMHTDYRLQLNMAGCGSGGAIDGWRMEQTLTRSAAAGPIDPMVPHLFTGTIKPPPQSTTRFSDDFGHGWAGWWHYEGAGTVTIQAVNQQLVVHADWTAVAGDATRTTTFAFAPYADWNPASGQTLECQVDLVSVSSNATNAVFAWIGTGSGTCYHFSKSQNAVWLGQYASGHGNTVFWCDNTVQLPAADVALHLALTRDQGSLIVTTRVLDRNNQNVLLFERSLVDTPQVDASLTTSEFRALTGITTASLYPDQGPPILAGRAMGVGVFQCSDGHQPPVDGIFDNFSFRLHDVPPMGMARAVQLTWPAPAGVNYAVEAAPTVLGPWLPVQELPMPGLQGLTVPLRQPAQFFRLRQAP